MKTLIKNSAIGLMIGSGAVCLICALIGMGGEAASGALLLIVSAIVKSLTT